MRQPLPTKWLFLLALTLISLGARTYAAEVVLAVLYPEVRAPYNVVFEDVISGIKKASKAEVKAFPLAKSSPVNATSLRIQKLNPTAVIALGNRSRAVASQLQGSYPVVYGSTFFANKNIEAQESGIALSPAPSALFKRLREIAPEVKRVSVVYHEPTNGWLIDLAAKNADGVGLELIAYAAKDVREAASHYKKILAAQENGYDAIWLLQGDPTLDQRGLLPTLLNQAWASYSIVFSSNPSHVRRGALFSLYPDNKNMGRSLWHKTQQYLAEGKPSVEPLEDLLSAINVRAAEHQNIILGRSELRDYELVFPTK